MAGSSFCAASIVNGTMRTSDPAQSTAAVLGVMPRIGEKSYRTGNELIMESIPAGI